MYEEEGRGGKRELRRGLIDRGRGFFQVRQVAKGSDNIVKQVVLVFLVVLGAYVLLFAGDFFLRTNKGPWRVRFFETNSAPAIEVSQERAGIRGVVLIFEGETLSNRVDQTMEFRQPKQVIPFGKTKFEDLTYLPGSVAFDLFGHEVELLPRTLYINKTEKGWTSGQIYGLKPSEKLPPEKFYDPRKKKKRFGGG